ncbi:MAG: ornithine carbamoyltransferase, partial [Anaerolineae bacterium]|nr:ornithine carbamoyltransferase [Anaerolineae bacterium]
MGRSWAWAATRLGFELVISAPKAYQPPAEFLERLGNGASVSVTEDPVEAAWNADVLYTDTWVSMGQEADAARRIQDLTPYQVNAALLAAAPAHAVVMHCLPAHRGQEITDELADGERSIIFQQAENRLHAQKAILVQLMVD